MINKINYSPDYIPPKSLGEGLRRVKEALGCTECIAKDIHLKNRLYKTEGGGTAYFTHAELHKTGKTVPESANLSHNDYDTFAGFALRIRRSDTCANTKTKPNQVMQLMKTWFYSDAVKDASGAETKPIKAVTNFKITKSEESTPIVEYFGRRKGTKDGDIPYSVKEISSKDVPTKNTEFQMPDGNIVYYLKDTVRDGKRAVDMKMYEVGLDVPIL